MKSGYEKSRLGTAGQFSDRIDTLFSQWDRDGSPGANVAVIQHGELIHQRGYGVANIEDDVPFTANTVLRLGSTSKHLCASCILILEERGQVSLDDAIQTYVPEFPDLGANITLRHLLTMTSGLWDGMNMLLFAGLDTSLALSRERLFRLACAQRELMFAPGDDCSYSNTNYSLLTLVIERVSGMSLADFMAVELFEPLGMSHTTLTTCMDQTIPNKAKGYAPTAEGQFSAAYMMVELDGAGGVDSTVADMSRWFLNYRDDQHFGPNFRQRLEAENRLNDGRLLSYRLGIEVENYRGLEVVRHSGGMPGYLCDFVFFPQADLGIILFTNLFDPDMLRLPDKIADIVITDNFRKPASTMNVAIGDGVADELIGTYLSGDGEFIVEIADLNGDLVAFVLGELNSLYEQSGWLRSRKNQAAIRALPDSRGGAIELRLGCESPRRLRSIDDPRLRPTAGPADIRQFAGSYTCDEIAEVHELSYKDSQLHVRIASPLRRLVWEPLTPVGGDVFVALIDSEPTCTNVLIRFDRDDNGNVSAMNYSINRCRNVRFQKQLRESRE